MIDAALSERVFVVKTSLWIIAVFTIFFAALKFTKSEILAYRTKLAITLDKCCVSSNSYKIGKVECDETKYNQCL